MFSNADEVLKLHQGRRTSSSSTSGSATCPASCSTSTSRRESVDEDFFADGQMFDGSSIRGFQAIHESDMKLIPDPTTAYVDPFRDGEDARAELLDPSTRSPTSPTAATRATSRPRPRRT